MNNAKIRVFTDFDGTITLKDLGDEIFKVFGKIEPYNSQLKNREIDIKEYWKLLCDSLPNDFDEKSIIDYATNSEIDPYFHAFADYCQDNEIPLYVVSDGYESYIKPILERENLAYLPVISNKLIFNSEQITPIFPGASESCKCFCASCKRNFVLGNASEDEIIVFIGDGYSDYCAAEHSDIIFAKRFLAKYCNDNKIPHYPFNTFFDVKRLLINAIEKGKLKKRNQAEVKRKNAFEQE